MITTQVFLICRIQDKMEEKTIDILSRLNKASERLNGEGNGEGAERVVVPSAAVQMHEMGDIKGISLCLTVMYNFCFILFITKKT